MNRLSSSTQPNVTADPCSILLEGVDADWFRGGLVCTRFAPTSPTRLIRYERVCVCVCVCVLAGSSRAFCGLTFRGWQRERDRKGLSRDRRERPAGSTTIGWRRRHTALFVRSLFPFSWKLAELAIIGVIARPILKDLNVKLATWNLNPRRNFTRTWTVTFARDLWAQLSLETLLPSPFSFVEFLAMLENLLRIILRPSWNSTCPLPRRTINFLAVGSPHFYARNHLSLWEKERHPSFFRRNFVLLCLCCFPFNLREILRAIFESAVADHASAKETEISPRNIFLLSNARH